MPNRINYPKAIRASGLSIYDPIDIDSEHFIPASILEELLNAGLSGFSTKGMALRTRSKMVKVRICEILGYPIPKSFIKTQPRFPGQNFDTYIQKSNNLQIWNEEISASRRYVLIREVDEIVSCVKVITGDVLAKLDTTGTLTQKYQARLTPGRSKLELISPKDTDIIAPITQPSANTRDKSPTDNPGEGLLPCHEIFKRLSKLVGETFEDAGVVQERNRGAGLHMLVCAALGYREFADDGQFPDIKHQLIEVKLQTSPTIDLGLVTPDSKTNLDIPAINGRKIRHCDIRYAIFEAKSDGAYVTITGLYLTTGESFFDRFPRFEGNVVNKKLQIPLPDRIFEPKSSFDL
jgi:hypothetical protein